MVDRKRIAVFFFLCAALLSGCRSMTLQQGLPDKESKFVVRTDERSIETGRLLFALKCSRCHDPYSTDRVFGPGLKGILKRAVLPVSQKPATPANIARQIRHPFYEMPAIQELSDDDILDIIAFLNTT
ncbi:MAG: cytochrome c [Nitrospirae bacterium]|nr:cytochrome c [Nitrospirota bacterium]